MTPDLHLRRGRFTLEGKRVLDVPMLAAIQKDVVVLDAKAEPPVDMLVVLKGIRRNATDVRYFGLRPRFGSVADGEPTLTYAPVFGVNQRRGQSVEVFVG